LQSAGFDLESAIMMLARSLTASLACAGLLFASACQKDADEKKSTEKKADKDAEKKAELSSKAAATRPRRPEIPPPDDVKAPPADAKKTPGGVSYKILTAAPAGATAQKPGPNDTVVVHYTGWTTDGKMFDSSVARKHPARFSLGGVIPGWTEGLQQIAVGEKARLWIPEELAYKGKKGAPAGTLVFDVELQEVIKAPEVPSDVAAPPKDAKKTAKGVFYKVLTPGTGKDKPHAWDRVKVQYTGWTIDGKMFDSSVTKGRPGDFSLQSVMPGWTDGMQTMVVGQKNRFWIPHELAYKDRPGRPQGMLVFDIELLEIKTMPEPPEVPKDVAEPPKDAQKTAKGVFYKVLKKGTGKDKPKETSKVKVHYTGWTTDGKMFDSSVTRGKPITFGLDGVIPGWTDGLQTMVVGQKSRFWIPKELAYEGKPGRPQGMLVFDVELLEIDPKAE
jgi:FKBP-type peptidyl-prolyl cis-trans isomerase